MRFLAGIFGLLIAAQAAAQDADTSAAGAGVSGTTASGTAAAGAASAPILSADISAGVTYDGITGMDQRRPKWIRTLSIAPRLAIPQLPVMDLLVKLSSLEDRMRQPFNRFSLATRWDWGSATAGDAYPQFSRFTLNGILLRGLSLDLTPGNLRAAVAGGYSRRAVEMAPGASPAYDQLLGGIKLGGGDRSGTRGYLNVIAAKDDASSIGPTGLVNPRQNLAGSIDGALCLWERALTIGGEIAGSAFSRDIRMIETALPRGMPGFVTAFYQPRISSQYDLAYTAEAQYARQGTTLKGSLKSIGPGYVTLGAPYLQNDTRGYELAAQQALWSRTLLLGAGYGASHDNLDHLQRATSTRSSGYGSVQFAAAALPSILAGFRFYRFDNPDVADASSYASRFRSFTVSGSYRAELLRLPHDLSASYENSSYSSISSGLAPGSDYDTWSLRGSWRTQVAGGVSVTASCSTVQSSMPQIGERGNRWQYRAGVALALWKNRLLIDGGGDYETEHNSSAMHDLRKTRWNAHLWSQYRTDASTLSLKVDRVVLSCASYPAGDYRELVVALLYSRRITL